MSVQWLPLVVQPPLDVSDALHRAVKPPGPSKVADVRGVPLGDLADEDRGPSFGSSI